MNMLAKKSISLFLIGAILIPSFAVPSFVSAQTSGLGSAASSLVACTGILDSVGSSISGYLSGSSDSGSQEEVPVAENDQRKKENCTDSIFRAAARMVLAYITDSIIKWINSGFEGDPTFISNPKAFFKDVANEVSGQFIEQLGLAGLCEPFRPQIIIALAQVPTFGQRYRCTALDVLDNLEDFHNDFSNGGWAGWFTIIQPQNNFYGTLYNAEADRARRIESAETYKRDELAQNNGFFSLRKCTAYHSDYAAGTQEEKDAYNGPWNEGGIKGCVDTEVVTPGKFIVESGVKINNAPIDDIISADEVNEMLAAIFNALINQLITDGFRSLSEPSTSNRQAWNADILDLPKLKKILAEIKVTGTEYYNVRKESVKVIMETVFVIDDALICYNDLQTRTGTDESQKIANLETQKIALQNTLAVYREKIRLLENAAPTLESLIAEAAKPDAQANLPFLIAQYETTIAPYAPTAQELSDAKADLNNQLTALTAAQTDLASCRQRLSTAPPPPTI